MDLGIVDFLWWTVDSLLSLRVRISKHRAKKAALLLSTQDFCALQVPRKVEGAFRISNGCSKGKAIVHLEPQSVIGRKLRAREGKCMLRSPGKRPELQR
jgi:hypothetical protein